MMFKKEYEPNQIDNWTCIFKTNIEFEAEMVQNFLLDRGYVCHILSKKDSSYVVDHSALSILYVYVPNEIAEEAANVLKELENAPLDEAFPDGDDDDGQD